MRTATIPALLSVLVLTLAACSPAVPKTPTAPLPPQPSSAGPATAPAATPPRTTAPAAPSRVPPVGRPVRGFDQSLLNGKEFLLQKSPVSTLQLPLDFDLGALDLLSDSARETAVSLIESVRHPETEVPLAPRWKEYLQARVALAREEAWTWQTLRWGSRDSSGTWQEFVLRSEGRTLTGQVYLRADDKGHWLVEDFQWQEVTAEEKFMPEATKTGGQLLP